MFSCSARRLGFLLKKKTCLLDQQEDNQEDMSTCSTRRHVFRTRRQVLSGSVFGVQCSVFECSRSGVEVRSDMYFVRVRVQ